ncbi:alpha-glucosidase [Psychromonas marina]|uniref:Alpha-glucosidase n=1 Tax=Psychromonas marina TaxID=88364 RepID=A0ABQ6E4W3_9GAMM|nr:alpha-glucosidase [Psychromonas marina]GLS92376.1 alpha-glucosidase [Psychromonas marina]
MAETITKKWWHNCVVYQIYPRSFKDSNGDGIGDIQGIISKLDYIQSLGVNVIWLSPVNQSPMDDNGYDISDYYNIAPEFGSMDDMELLITESNKRNIKILMDLVINHTSDEHPWFIESKSSVNNPKRDWYIWKEPKPDGSEPNNWESFFTPKAWEFDDLTQQFYLHLFSKKQPDLNWANPEVREAIHAVLHFWLKKGIGGFRMDVINMIGKPDDFPDATIFDEGVSGWEHWANNLLCHQYLREINDKVLSHYDVMTVAETPFTSTLDGRYYSHPARNEVSMIFHFEHMSIDREEHNAVRKPFDLREYKEIMSRWQKDLYQKGWNSLYWSNHDQPRTVSRFGCDNEQYRTISAKMLGTITHMMSGTPYVYQGEELGMTNKVFTDIEQFNDLMAKFHYQKILASGRSEKQAIDFLNYFSRDHARLPMQWDNTANGGFTTGKPWLALNNNFATVNVQAEINNKDSIFNYYQRLITLRKSNKYGEVITYGDYQALDVNDAEVFAYRRCYHEYTLLIICNFSDHTLQRNYAGEIKEFILGNYANVPTCLEDLTLKPYQAFIFEIR